MAIVLNTPLTVEYMDMVYLATAKQLAETNPFSIAQAKTDLEASQSVTFSTESFTTMLQYVYNLDIDRSQLSAHEQDMYNKILQELSPAPFLQNCNNTDDPVAGGVTLALQQDFTATANYAMTVTFENPYKCSILQISLTQVSGTLTPTNIPTLTLLGAIEGKNTFTGLWLEYSEVPSGTYEYQLTFKDVDGNTVGSTVNKTISI